MMDEALYQEIEQYLSGNMTEQEAERFEQKMAQDDALAEEVRLYAQVNHHLSNSYELGQPIPDTDLNNKTRTFLKSNEATEIRDTISRMHKAHAAPVGVPQRRRRVGFIAAALVLFASALAVMYLQNPSPERLFNEYYDTSELPSVVSRNDDPNSFQLGAVEFQNGNFEEALAYFDTYIGASLELDPNVYLYAGAAYLELSQFDEAHQQFDLMAASGTLDASRGLWFKALAYLKANNLDEARDVLDQISSNPNNFNAEEARQLLEKLD